MSWYRSWYEDLSGKCRRCTGTGVIALLGFWACPDCEGTGVPSSTKKKRG